MEVKSVSEGFVLYIMESPLVNLIWVGLALMCLGVASLVPWRPTQ